MVFAPWVLGVDLLSLIFLHHVQYKVHTFPDAQRMVYAATFGYCYDIECLEYLIYIYIHIYIYLDHR